jgi:hypothetical protein
MARQQVTGEKHWYVLHTYSGYEDSVAFNLHQRIESMGMEDKIFNVLVPKEKKIKIKDGKRVTVEEKIFPGYVLVEMIVTDDSWYVVRNTPNVTGFRRLWHYPNAYFRSRNYLFAESAWVSKNPNTKSMSASTIWSGSWMDRLKITKARLLKPMMKKVKSKSWFRSLAAKLRWNWTFYKLRKYNFMWYVY